MYVYLTSYIHHLPFKYSDKPHPAVSTVHILPPTFRNTLPPLHNAQKSARDTADPTDHSVRTPDHPEI